LTIYLAVNILASYIARVRDIYTNLKTKISYDDFSKIGD